MRVALLGYSGETHLKACYGRAFEMSGHDVLEIDYDHYYRKETKWGVLGRMLKKLRPPNSWAHYANRNILGDLLEFKPHLTCLFGNFDVSLGMIAYLKNITNCRLCLIWPDPLFSIHQHLFPAARIIDSVATYSKQTIGSFEQFGYQRVFWLPFAGDDFAHYSGEPTGRFDCDFSFVGGWRPERQHVLENVLAACPEIKLQIHGPNWKKICRGSEIAPFCSNRSVTGKAYADLCAKSRICLNVMDRFNYPAANMRFFELPTAGALQLSSFCPEMSDQFVHREHVVYFDSEDDLVEQVRWILNNASAAEEIRRAARQLAASKHSYLARSQSMLSSLGMDG